MDDLNKKFSVVVFPFLKTSGPVSIGNITFSSTDCTDGLSVEQTACVKEIAEMLFLQDHYRIKSASFAIVPYIDPPSKFNHLMDIQDVVSYIYVSPRHSFGDVFLSSEHASMAIFTPESGSQFLAHPTFHVDLVEPNQQVTAAISKKIINGYSGIYNFRHHFWVTKGSRLYGPMPRLTLNHYQDLKEDFNRASTSSNRADFRLLCELLRKPRSSAGLRIFNSIRWFHAANNKANEPMTAIIMLAIAFETLMRLPSESKSAHLIDAISLLLGRIRRIDIWASQFYKARSQIVHEGFTQELRYIATDSPKNNNGQRYQSLLSYGRKIFQLCIGTILTGAELSELAGLEETLITNQERFQKVCKILKDTESQIGDRVARIKPIIEAIEEFQVVPEENLQLETMFGALRLVAKTQLEIDNTLSQDLRDRLKQISNAKRSKTHLQELEALKNLQDFLSAGSSTKTNDFTETVRSLVRTVWNYVFYNYYLLKNVRAKSK